MNLVVYHPDCMVLSLPVLLIFKLLDFFSLKCIAFIVIKKRTIFKMHTSLKKINILFHSDLPLSITIGTHICLLDTAWLPKP